MQRIDLTNKTFGKLTVLGLDNPPKRNSSGKLLWKCQCSCGNICYKTKDSLERKSQKPKACSIRCSSALSIGEKFNRLTILELIATKGQETSYKCLCDCGNITTVYGQNLKNGTTKSCGCLQKERMSIIGSQNINYANLKGQRFGRLIALEPTSERVSENTRSVIWRCICDCGTYYNASVANLKNGYVTHCSNCKISSKGEEKIIELLTINNILFEKEKSFDTCRFKDTNALARFDFYVNNQYLIEFDGVQHFKYDNGGWNNEEQFKKTQIHDKYKNNWCKENNIPLIRIPYWHLDQLCLEDLLLETSKMKI